MCHRNGNTPCCEHHVHGGEQCLSQCSDVSDNDTCTLNLCIRAVGVVLHGVQASDKEHGVRFVLCSVFVCVYVCLCTYPLWKLV